MTPAPPSTAPRSPPAPGRPASRSGSAALPRLPALELPGYLLLTWVFLAGPMGRLVGASWALATVAATVVVWAAALRWTLRLRWPTRSDAPALATAAVGLAGVAWYLRTGHNDDAFCHHGFVALIERLGMPAVAPGDPTRVAEYHTAVDALAAALQPWLRLDVEGRLDLTSVLAHGTLALASISLLRAVGARPAERALGVLTLLFGAGLYWLATWVPQLQPAGFPWATHWEGGTYLSVFALSGRRSSVLGFLVAVLALRLFMPGNAGRRVGLPPHGGGQAPAAPSWQATVLLALLAGSASQCADELVVLVVAAAGLWLLQARSRGAWLRVVAPCLALAPLALAGGGFAGAWVTALFGGAAPMGTAATGGGSLGGGWPVSLTWPSWPSFHGPNPSVFGLDGVRVALLELLPAALIPPLAWRRGWLPAAAAQTLMLWWALGLLVATWLRLPALGYDVDLHRALEPALALGLLLVPYGVRRLSPRRPLWPAVAAAVVVVGPVGRLLGAPGGGHGLLPMHGPAGAAAVLALCLAGATSLAWLGKLAERRRARPSGQRAATAVAAAVTALALGAAGWTLADPRHVGGGPPPLPPLLAQAVAGQGRVPVLADARLGNLLLRHGHPVVAPWLRSDLEPLDPTRHDRALTRCERDDWGDARTFWLRGSTYRAIQARHPGALQPLGSTAGRATPAIWRAWPAMRGPHAAPATTVWGRVVGRASRPQAAPRAGDPAAP